MVHFVLLFNNIKILFMAEQYQIQKYAYEDFLELLFIISGLI